VILLQDDLIPSFVPPHYIIKLSLQQTTSGIDKEVEIPGGLKKRPQVLLDRQLSLCRLATKRPQEDWPLETNQIRNKTTSGKLAAGKCSKEQIFKTKA